MAFANKARRNGVVSLDADLQTIQDPFLKQTLMLAVDGTEPAELRKIMRVSLDSITEDEERLPAVFESAGGFSPTIGILGAVLGLIQVMQHLDNINEVGRGIAVAFVATIYGVGIANLFFLPFAGKMRHAHPQRPSPPRDDAGGRDLHSRRHEPAHAGDQAGRLPGRLEPRNKGARRMSRRVPRSRVTHDRWLVSYADFITLLFGFFVVLYAFAKADQKKQVQVSQAIDSAFRSMGVFPVAPRDPSATSGAGADQAVRAHKCRDETKTCSRLLRSRTISTASGAS